MDEKSTVFLSENLKFYKNKTNEGDCTILVMIDFSVPFKAPDIFFYSHQKMHRGVQGAS